MPREGAGDLFRPVSKLADQRGGGISALLHLQAVVDAGERRVGLDLIGLASGDFLQKHSGPVVLAGFLIAQPQIKQARYIGSIEFDGLLQEADRVVQSLWASQLENFPQRE